ncbi:alpha/beta hydrolase [Nonomuraea sp. NPDC050310]|uniref:alpha/beta fold hydrolase n=1 Tax=unclassified Nonomuraea TaxID=2593643 RepID=UPI0034109E1C
MSPDPVSGYVTSADGTRIAYDRCGSGPVVILVHGAFTGRDHPTLRGVAAALAPWFTVVNYDRRGRGGSTDTQPYAVEREVEDLVALVEAGGGPALVFGGSSGAALAVRAAASCPAIGKLALWEPPYHVDDSAPRLPYGLAGELEALVRAGRRGDAVEAFMVAAVELPAEAVAAMRAHESWGGMEALAHTLAYEAHVMGPGNRLPEALLGRLDRPALVLNGELSPGWMRLAGLAVAKALPHGVHRVLEGQAHNVEPRALAPELLEFFTA